MKKYGEVLSYRTASKAVKGKKYIFEDMLKKIRLRPEECVATVLTCVLLGDSDYPFMENETSKHSWQFCREVIEEETRMTNRQLAEWLEKGNGQKAYLKNEYEPKEGIDLEPVFTTHEYDGKYDDESCGEAVRIRSWGSDDWVVPNLEIYERDCKHD